jgi:prolyl oligopeptidase
VKAQNTVTAEYLAGIPFRAAVKARLSQMWNYPKYGSPRQEGTYYYFSKNDGLQNQSVLYRQKGLEGIPEVFLDPNRFSVDGTVALAGLSFSKDARYAAYQIASSGSDWQEAIIMDLRTGQRIDDTIRYIKFSGIAWQGDKGFYYSRYPVPDANSKLSKQNQFHKVYFHTIGTQQESDLLIYEDNEHPLRNVGAEVTEDERFLILSTTEGTSGNELWVKDLQQPAASFTRLIEGFETEPDVIDHNGKGVLLVRTNQDAPNYKVVLIDPKRPAVSNWVTVIAEKQEVLQSVGTAGGYLFCSYLKDASTKVYQYTYSGKLVREIQLPGLGTASGFSGKMNQQSFFYTFTSYTYPPTIFKYDIKSGVSSLFRKTETAFNSEAFETKQVFFTSKDGTRVPMFITGKKGFQLDGTNPVLLYGYGGFNIAQTPGFSISNAFWLEQGGLYVVVNLRGGNEYG